MHKKGRQIMLDWLMTIIVHGVFNSENLKPDIYKCYKRPSSN